MSRHHSNNAARELLSLKIISKKVLSYYYTKTADRQETLTTRARESDFAQKEILDQGFRFMFFYASGLVPPHRHTLWTDASGFSVDASGPLLPPIRFGQGGWGRGDVPGNGNGNAGNSPIRFRQVSDYDPFLDTDSLIAQIPCLVGSSQPLLLVYTVLHKGWISEQIVSVPGVRSRQCSV